MFITKIYNPRENNMMIKYWLSLNNNTKTIREINWIINLWSQFKTQTSHRPTVTTHNPCCSQHSTTSSSLPPKTSSSLTSNSKTPNSPWKTTKISLKRSTKLPPTSHSEVQSLKQSLQTLLEMKDTWWNPPKSHSQRIFPAQFWSRRT